MTSQQIRTSTNDMLSRRIKRINRILKGNTNRGYDKFMLRSEREQIVRELYRRDEIEVTQ